MIDGIGVQAVRRRGACLHRVDIPVLLAVPLLFVARRGLRRAVDADTGSAPAGGGRRSLGGLVSVAAYGIGDLGACESGAMGAVSALRREASVVFAVLPSGRVFLGENGQRQALACLVVAAGAALERLGGFDAPATRRRRAAARTLLPAHYIGSATPSALFRRPRAERHTRRPATAAVAVSEHLLARRRDPNGQPA